MAENVSNLLELSYYHQAVALLNTISARNEAAARGEKDSTLKSFFMEQADQADYLSDELRVLMHNYQTHVSMADESLIVPLEEGDELK